MNVNVNVTQLISICLILNELDWHKFNHLTRLKKASINIIINLIPTNLIQIHNIKVLNKHTIWKLIITSNTLNTSSKISK